MIRQALPTDVDHIVALGEKFHAHSPYSAIPYDPDATAQFVANVVAQGVVFITDDGMCGGILAPLFFNPSTILAVELFWWAPSNGRELRKAFEGWAEEHGALPQFSALADERGGRMDRLYARAGYRRTETSYVKGI